MKPTFDSTTAGDRIRNITGTVQSGVRFMSFNNAFYAGDGLGNIPIYSDNLSHWGTAMFNASRVVPTGVDNAGRTFPILLWQRIN